MENLMAQIDEDGFDTGIFSEICRAQKNDAIAIPDGESAYTEINGRRSPIITTTKGWNILVKWKDQSTNWVPLSIAKESFPTMNLCLKMQQ
jgi:hypothetical protein